MTALYYSQLSAGKRQSYYADDRLNIIITTADGLLRLSPDMKVWVRQKRYTTADERCTVDGENRPWMHRPICNRGRRCRRNWGSTEVQEDKGHVTNFPVYMTPLTRMHNVVVTCTRRWQWPFLSNDDVRYLVPICRLPSMQQLVLVAVMNKTPTIWVSDRSSSFDTNCSCKVQNRPVRVEVNGSNDDFVSWADTPKHASAYVTKEGNPASKVALRSPAIIAYRLQCTESTAVITCRLADGGMIPDVAYFVIYISVFYLCT